MAQVIIKNGSYRKQDITGTFELVKEWTVGKKGGFVTVVNDGSAALAAGPEHCRILVKQEDVEQIGELAASTHAPGGKSKEAPKLKETDEQTMARIEKTFSFINTLAAAAQRNQITGLIISGPAGVGKSYGVEYTLERMNMTRKLKQLPEKFEIVTGSSSAVSLYIKLWDNRKEGNVLVFDDCDSALWDEPQLNLMKAAMDTKKRRKICWMKESNALKGRGDEEGENIPESFYFEGSIIFLTNIKFDRCKSKKIADHLKAIASRVHYLDLQLDSTREQLLRVKQVVEAGMLDDKELSDKMKDEVVNYVYDNVDYLAELSLRTVLKVADLAAVYTDTWQDVADMTILSHKGRIQKAIDNGAEVVEA